MSERVRVLQFVCSFAAGGTERHVTSLLHSHDRDHFEPFVGCLSKEGLFSSDLAPFAQRVAEFPIRRMYGTRTWLQQLRLARHLRARRIQVLHAYGFYGNCFAIPAARLAGVPVIVASIRSNEASWTSSQRRVERWICRFAHAVLTNADSVRQRLVGEGYDPGKVAVIPNGIDVTRFSSPRRAHGLRDELGIGPKAPLVGVVARVDPIKGLEYFLEAAREVSRRMPEVRFVIVGDSHPLPVHQAYRRDLEERSRALGLAGKLFFTGTRSDIPEVFADLDVSVLPSLSEGLPNVILEAMAAGVPVVASAVGGIPEVVQQQVNGLLVAPRDAAGLAAAVERLLDRPEEARQLAQRARELVHARFSQASMARSTEEHYLRLLAGRGESVMGLAGGSCG